MTVLLLVLFAVSMTAVAVSADGDKHNNYDSRYWSNDGWYKHDGNNWHGHYYNGNFYHNHGHWDGEGKDRYWSYHWHKYSGDGHKEESRYL